mmetsp:Transcript_3122/g.6434  ORF Transcript_3122/g.6434 Transcript_3122/m.6434 type:complete len:200 (+) Transcript_3122:2101-2700(+)
MTCSLSPLALSLFLPAFFSFPSFPPRKQTTLTHSRFSLLSPFHERRDRDRIFHTVTHTHSGFFFFFPFSFPPPFHPLARTLVCIRFCRSAFTRSSTVVPRSVEREESIKKEEDKEGKEEEKMKRPHLHGCMDDQVRAFVRSFCLVPLKRRYDCAACVAHICSSPSRSDERACKRTSNHADRQVKNPASHMHRSKSTELL